MKSLLALSKESSPDAVCKAKNKACLDICRQSLHALQATGYSRSGVNRQPTKTRQELDAVLSELSLMEAGKENTQAVRLAAPSVTNLAAGPRHSRSGSM